MADICDQADDVIQAGLDNAADAARHAGRLPARGRCHNCDALLVGDLRFCDADCRDDWQRREDQRRRTGG